MPYMLEKGATLRLIEQYLNAPVADRLRYLNLVRDSEAANDVRWFTTGPPGLWSHGAFARRPPPAGETDPWSGEKERDLLMKTWFGLNPDGSPAPPLAAPPTPSTQAAAAPATTGFWIAYQGDVHRITRRAVRWALELSLGLGPADQTPTRDWPIEVFWKCLAPWFEAWVTNRPAPGGHGVVSLLLISPSHHGANVAESPIAHSPTVLTTGGKGVPSTQDDYEVLDLGGAAAYASAGASVVPAHRREYASWVVTHEQQQKVGTVLVSTNAADSDIADWGIPQLACYRGTGTVVVVSPSLAAGGVKHDGSV